MALTVEDFDDLIRLLEENAEWRQRLRQLLLGEEMVVLPAQVQALQAAIGTVLAEVARQQQEQTRLLSSLLVALQTITASIQALVRVQERQAEEFVRSRLEVDRRFADLAANQAKLEEAQIRTEERLAKLEEAVAALAEAQRQAEERLTRLEEAVAALAEAQRRTEEQVRQLAEAQRQAEERLARLEEAQIRTEERLARLEETVARLAEAQRQAEERLARLEEAVAALAEAQRRTEEQVRQLAEAQRQTEERVRRLEEAQIRTEERLARLEETVAKLAEAQRQAEERLARLEEAQIRTEERLARLEEAQIRMEERMARLEETQIRVQEEIRDLIDQIRRLTIAQQMMGDQLNRFGSVVGIVAEERMAVYMERWLESQGYQVQIPISSLPLDSETEIDGITQVRDAEGNVEWVLISVRVRVRPRDFEDFTGILNRERVKALLRERGIQGRIRPFIFGMTMQLGAIQAARQHRIGLILSERGEMAPAGLWEL